MSIPEVHGTCAPRFGRAKDVFAAHFRDGKEIGAAFALTLDGEPVIDLWAGFADPACTRVWERDTLVNVYSTTKGMTAICALRLADEGRLDLDAPVTRYWPEFGAAGKERIPVRQLLNHRAGLAAIRKTLPDEALFDWSAMTRALAAEAPWWEPGSAHGYHALTIGWLVGEVVRRITGKSLGTYFRDEIARPLGLDFHIGLAASEDVRVADMTPPPLEHAPGEPSLIEIVLQDPQSITARAFMNPPSLMQPGTVNSRAWRGAEIPGANGHGTARALARVYGALACGGTLDRVRVLSPATIERARHEEAYGPDLVLKLSTRVGLGFFLAQPTAALGPNLRAFGHPGAGGSLGYADPEARVGFGYVMNRMGPHILLDPRPLALIDAVYAALG